MLEGLKRAFSSGGPTHANRGPRAPERRSSDALVTLAQRALKRPGSITLSEVRSLAASVLSQAKTGDGK